MHLLDIIICVENMGLFHLVGWSLFALTMKSAVENMQVGFILG